MLTIALVIGLVWQFFQSSLSSNLRTPPNRAKSEGLFCPSQGCHKKIDTEPLQVLNAVNRMWLLACLLGLTNLLNPDKGKVMPIGRTCPSTNYSVICSVNVLCNSARRLLMISGDAFLAISTSIKVLRISAFFFIFNHLFQLVMDVFDKAVVSIPILENL